jgi:NAD+ kinase
MQIALFGRSFNDFFSINIQQLITKLEDSNVDLLIYEPFYEVLKTKIKFGKKHHVLKNHLDLKKGCDCLFSLGGDGTMLDTITLIRDSGVPVLGINTGRLGFLANVTKEEIENAVDEVLNGQFTIDQRSLLRLETDNHLFGELNFALNELTISKKDSSSLISISCFVNDELLNSYWADGLIIATPTGSTAYSLSCGGPIITPDSKNFIINPIASHNLTVRPVVIPDESKIRLQVNGRGNSFLVSLDSRAEFIDNTVELRICKEQFNINLVKLKNENFFTTIRNKLMWGIDKRN